jgi:hypothetical protein
VERVFLPRSAEVDAAESALRWGLVAFVSGQRDHVTLSEAGGAISAHVPLVEDNFTIHRHWPSDFLIKCGSQRVRDEVAAAGIVDGRGFSLRFSPWNRQLQAVRHEARIRAHLELVGVPAHACSKAAATAVLGSAAWVKRLGAASASGEDLGRLQVVVWTDDLALLPRAKELLVEEPDDLLEDDDGLILPGDAPIPLEKDMLRYNVSVKVFRSEGLAGERRAPSPGGDDSDGGGGGPRCDRRWPRSWDLSDRRDGRRELDDGRQRRDGSSDRGGGRRDGRSGDRRQDDRGKLADTSGRAESSDPASPTTSFNRGERRTSSARPESPPVSSPHALLRRESSEAGVTISSEATVGGVWAAGSTERGDLQRKHPTTESIETATAK